MKYLIILFLTFSSAHSQSKSSIVVNLYSDYYKDKNISVEKIMFTKDSIPYIHKTYNTFKNEKLTFHFNVDSIIVVNLGIGPKCTAYILEPKQTISIKEAGSTIKDIVAGGSNKYGLKFLDWSLTMDKPMSLAEPIFDYNSSEKMIYFFEDEFNKNVRKPLTQLLKEKKITRQYKKALEEALTYSWVMAYITRPNEFKKKDRLFIEYLLTKYDPFESKNNIPSRIRMYLIKKKALYIKKGVIHGKLNYTGIWEEKENVYYYIPEKLQPLIAVEQMLQDNQNEAYAYDYTKGIWKRFKELYPSHPNIPMLRKVFSHLKLKHEKKRK